MKIYQMIFSPTGGTQKVSNLLSGAMDGSVETIDLTDRDKDFGAVAVGAEDLVLIAVPSYGGRVPQPAIDRILQIRGNGAAAVLICAYGNRAYEDTLVELEDAACQAGFFPVAAVAAVAEHSVVRKFAAGRPDADDQVILREFASRILKKYRGAARTKPALPGNRPYKKRGGSGMVPLPTKSCVYCGYCAAHCPTGAIDGRDPAKVDVNRCISCMRCVTICPQAARAADEKTVAAVAEMLQKVCADRKENELFL